MRSWNATPIKAICWRRQTHGRRKTREKQGRASSDGDGRGQGAGEKVLLDTLVSCLGSAKCRRKEPGTTGGRSDAYRPRVNGIKNILISRRGSPRSSGITVQQKPHSQQQHAVSAYRKTTHNTFVQHFVVRTVLLTLRRLGGESLMC